jgi:hypothetical protein
MSMPTLSSIVSRRFDIVVWGFASTWRPPWSWPEAPPASTIGSGS